MSDSVERFRKRRAVLSDTDLFAQHSVRPTPRMGAESASAGGLPVIVLPDDEGHALVAVDADALLAEIHGRLDSEKIGALIDACQKECLQAVIRPFGLARVLFDDKLGGNVATVHNVRSAEYRNEENTAWKHTGEKEKYNSEMAAYEEKKRQYKAYVKEQAAYKKWEDSGRVGDAPPKPTPVSDPKYKYRGGSKKYNRTKESYETQKQEGTLENSFGQGKFEEDDEVHVDHAHPCEEIEKDPARVLAEIYGPDLANIDENLNPMLGHINLSKNDLSAEEAIARWEKEEPKRLKKIRALKAMQENGTISPEQEAHLKKLEQLQAVNKEELVAAVEKAKAEIDRRINRKYYTSSKFLKNAAVTSATEGGRMALQQSVGVLMEEFVRAAFAEVRDVWHNGFRGKVDDAFLDVLKLRLTRVADRVQAKWKDAAVAFRDGFISGFLSNLVTIAINAFVTTSARLVRITREGFMSLYRAMKTLAFPPEGMSLAEAADAASKLLVAGVVTGGGILLEEVVEKALAGALGPLAPYVSAIAVGVATGLCTVFAVHMLDRLDLFGVNARTRHAQVMAKLDETISLSYDRALEAASAFDPPSLPHLA